MSAGEKMTGRAIVIVQLAAGVFDKLPVFLLLSAHFFPCGIMVFSYFSIDWFESRGIIIITRLWIIEEIGFVNLDML